MSSLEVIALPVRRPVTPGDDLADVLVGAVADARTALADGDVVAVASKVVAVVEGATVPTAPEEGATDREWRRALARRLARRIVADSPRALVVETHHGLVCANAGIDASNVPAGHVVTLPEDPDASARRLRARVAERLGVEVGVLVTDTFGRPWRLGQTDVAIGAAGVAVLRDERGGRDLQGHPLEVTMAAVADELAAAADLVRTKDSATPFVLLRGPDVAGTGAARDLVRPSEEDLFPAGGPTLFSHAVTSHAGGSARDGAPVDAEVLRQALDAVATPACVVAPRAASAPATHATLVVACPVHDADHLLSAGAVIERLRILLAGHGIAVERRPVDDAPVPVGAPDGWIPVAVVAIGQQR